MSILHKEVTLRPLARYWIVGLIVLSLLIVGCQSTEDEDLATPEVVAAEKPENEESRNTEPTEAPAEGSSGASQSSSWEPIIQEFDGVEMAEVPAGCFMMGDSEVERAQPVHEVCITEPYWIDVTEVSNGQFKRLGGEAQREPDFPGQAISSDELPRTSITWEEAADFCQLRGGRLSTEAEWEYAARGPDGWVYPWGDEFVPTRLNFCDQNCPLGGSDEGAFYSTDDGYKVAAPVDSFPEGASWVGALHMAGNVAEWVSDWYDPDYYASAPRENPTGPESGRHQVVKSTPWAWWTDPESFSQAANRWDFIPDSAMKEYSGTTGFRCVRAGN